MPTFPLKYRSVIRSGPGVLTDWVGNENTHACVNCSVPAEFRGSGTGFSPEGLLGLSLLSCITGLFKILCEKFTVKFDSLEGEATVSMNQDPSNHVVISSIEVRLKIFGASDPVKVKQLMDTTIKTCPVGHALKIEKTFHVEVF